MNKTILTHGDIDARARHIAEKLKAYLPGRAELKAYAIPRGGIPAAYAIQQHARFVKLVDSPEEADIFIDDIVDSGTTAERYQSRYDLKPFYALCDKTLNPDLGWVVFPWEPADPTAGIEDNITRLIEWMGENPEREGLKNTPARVAKAWRHWCSGYDFDTEEKVANLLRVFSDGGERYDEMVLERNLPFYSFCEHHLAPIFGVAHIAYIPDGKIVGLSKIPRLLEVFGRRLQVQERLTQQVADALFQHLQPKGVAVMIRARHFCMESRGIEKQGHDTTTTALRGVFKSSAAARAEFLQSVS